MTRRIFSTVLCRQNQSLCHKLRIAYENDKITITDQRPCGEQMCFHEKSLFNFGNIFIYMYKHPTKMIQDLIQTPQLRHHLAHKSIK